MRRGKTLSWERLRARAAAWPLAAIAALFIGVSGFMTVTFGYRLGEAAGLGLVFAAFAVAVEGFADLAMPLLWRRIGLAGRVLLVAFFALCLAYKLEAAKRFAAENLGLRDAAAATAAVDYEAARQRVESLRRAVAENAEARPAGVIQAEIDGLLRDPRAEGCNGAINGEVTRNICPKVDRLRGELARAGVRDRAEAELAPAIAAWRGSAPAAATAQDGVGPVGAALALAGVQIGSWSQLVALLVMIIVEAGAIVVPMLIGLAFGDGRRPQPAEAAPAMAAPAKAPAAGADLREELLPKASPRGMTPKAKRDTADLTVFLAERTERGADERVQSTTLYFVYSEWKQGRGEEPMTVNQFGTVLTHHLGLAKAKSDGKIWYQNIRLRHPDQGRKAARHLRVAGGVAS
jgi:hypothetical protein